MKTPYFEGLKGGVSFKINYKKKTVRIQGMKKRIPFDRAKRLCGAILEVIKDIEAAEILKKLFPDNGPHPAWKYSPCHERQDKKKGRK